MSEPSLCLAGQGCLLSIGGKVTLGAALNPHRTSLVGSQAVCKLISALQCLGSIPCYPKGRDGDATSTTHGLVL